MDEQEALPGGEQIEALEPSRPPHRRLRAWLSILAGAALACAALPHAFCVLLVLYWTRWNRQVLAGALLWPPVAGVASLGGIIVADGCILLRHGRRSPRLRAWAMSLGAALLVAAVLTLPMLRLIG